MARATLAQALFAPRAVALVGASGDAGKNTARPQRFMRKHGYTGRIVPINPGRSEILGEAAYPALADAPGEIDHAFIMVPAAQVATVLTHCAARGVPLATIYSDGFAETGPEGAERERKLVEHAKKLGVRVIGPNSIGLANVTNGATITVNAVFEMDALPRGGASVVSQSGTMIGTLISRGAARGMGFSKLVSMGNESDVSVGEIVEVLADDPDTQVILLFLETIRDAERLAQAARRAHAAGKAVVAYKLGRSALGEALAKSHTGALAGSDAAVDAYFRRNGIVRVDMLETLVEIVPLLSGRKPPRLKHQPRVAVVTTTGGGAASVVDRLGTLGISTLTPDAALIASLKDQGVAIRSAPIIDLTLASTADKYRAVLEALLAHPDCDAALAVVGSSAQFHPELAVKPIVGVARGAKPLAAFLAPNAEASLRLMADAGVPAFRTPEGCADALSAYFAWHAPTDAPKAPVPEWPAALPRTGALDEAQALALFDALGVPTVSRETARAPQFAHTLPYPVAAKVLSRDILHKTEVGGVALGIADREAYEARIASLLDTVRSRAPAARIDGVLVQPMVKGLAEAIVGYRHDSLVGPVVLVGMGGQLAEIYRDTALECAPVSEEQALAMIARVKGFALLSGYRNLPRGDLRALARAVVAVSRLASLPGRPVAEAEINPLMVLADGVAAVDGLVVMKGSA
ncbi:MAG: acetate--CoA ligase family protein [Proteobacteria bacterium]|nr:acetate--CoA ligase family protein [Pseudomonadota bacterium]